MSNSMMQTGPAGDHWEDVDSVLPIGQTCADCVHQERCQQLLGSDFKIESSVCDWSPSRFRPIAAAMKITEEQYVESVQSA